VIPDVGQAIGQKQRYVPFEPDKRSSKSNCVQSGNLTDSRVLVIPEGDSKTQAGPRAEGGQNQVPAMTHHQKARLPAIYALLEKFDWLDDVRSLIEEIRQYSDGLGSSPSEILAWGELVYPQLKDEDLEGRWLHAAMAKAFANPAAPRYAAERTREERGA
jgi:hypothetical protein